MHQPVLLKEVISHLNLKEGDIVLDATVGGGGHAAEILKRIGPDGRLLGLDADESAIRRTEDKLKNLSGSVSLIKGNFRDLDMLLSKTGIKSLDAALFDVGISSYQLEDASRGFSMKYNARLDMRMNTSLDLTAYDIVNNFKESQLSDIIKTYGEERMSKAIARQIVKARAEKPIETTHELAEIVRRAAGFSYRKSKIDPATRTFQAIRIVVNDELGALEEGLKKAVSWLDTGGRVCVISFHSLEDRIVKRLFKGYASLGILNILTKKPIRPSDKEIAENPRSRSAKLRVAERI